MRNIPTLQKCMWLLILFAMTASTAAAQDRFVDAGSGVDTGDCSSSISPCATIGYAVGQAASGDVIQVAAGTYVDAAQVVINKDIDLVGSGSATTFVKLSFDTGSSGDARGWYLVDAGFSFNVSDLTMDGTGQKVYQGVRYKGAAGSFTNVVFKEIKFPTYSGVAVAAFGTGTVDFTGCAFSEIGRVGVLYFGIGVNGSAFSNNSYTGKGDGDFLDYALDISAGAVVAVDNNTISENRGVASSDGSTSAGILVTTFFGGGTGATVTDNTISNSTTGIYVGFDTADTSDLTAEQNNLFGNGNGIAIVGGGTISVMENYIHDNEDGLDLNNDHIASAAINQNCIVNNAAFGLDNGGTAVVDAESNFWGTADGPSGAGPGLGDAVSANVDFDPFETAPIAAIAACTAIPTMTVVITPSTPGWGFLQETATGSGQFVSGPDTPPLGVGSAELTVDAAGGEIFGAVLYQGLRLDEITKLRYSTYRQTFDSGDLLAIALQFNIDYDLTDGDVSWQGRLVFEPYNTGANVPEDTWQTWDPMTAGAGWWASGAPGNGTCPQASPCTFAQVLAAFPNAGIHATLGVVLFKAGSNWSKDFTGNVDNFIIGTSSLIKIYDFEPECNVADKPSWDGNFTGGETVGGGTESGRGYMLVQTLNGFTGASLNLGQSTNIALLDITRGDGSTLPGGDLSKSGPLSGAGGAGWTTIDYTGSEVLMSVRVYVTWLNTGGSQFMFETGDQCGFTGQADPAVELGAPVTFALERNYPNPFNPQTSIRFSLPDASEVTLEVFDVMGRKVQTLLSGRLDAGFHEAVWNGTNASGAPVASGVYLYRIQAGEFNKVMQMILMK